MIKVMEVRLLGPTELVLDGRSLEPPRMVRAVLAMLALESPTAVRTEELADRLWAGRPPASAGSVVRTYISQLRRMLPNGAMRVERVRDGYSIRLEPDELDVSRFETLVSSAMVRRSEPAVVERMLGEALSLWRGAPLGELADDPRAVVVAAGLEERRWAAVELLADAQVALGRHADAIALLDAARTEAPLREQLVAQLMVALYRSGRQADAIGAFQRLRSALVEDLGLDPSPELRRLEAAVLAQDPSLDAPPQRIGNVPAHSTSLVGRIAELDTLATALVTSRLVTLTGPGGAGKTRLAVELAMRVQFPDGAWVVDLTSLRDSRDVATAVLEAIAGDDRSHEDPAVAVCRAARGKRMLLVLDNCEHVLADAASLVNELLRATPDVRVVATSRAALGVAGELVWEVPPLASPPSGVQLARIADFDAARLLAERVAAARGGRAPEGAEWEGIGRLCRSLDGLPLAIELVAAQAAALPLAELADMADRGSVDAIATTSSGGHHRSLAACISWSVSLLEPEHHRLMQLVCLLPGPFSVGVAAAVAAETDQDRTMAALAHLARQSLLQPVRAEPAQFRVLETIRHAVRATVDPSLADDALGRLAAWAADWVESVEPALRGPEAARALDELDSQRDVLHAVLEHGLASADPTNAVRIAASMSALWSYRGHFREGQRWLTRAVAVAEFVAVPVAARIRLLVAAGTHQMAIGDTDTFRRHVNAALSLARSVAADADALRVLLWAGHASTLQPGDPSRRWRSRCRLPRAPTGA